jgi:ketosteroid isomerase-like protein
MTSYETVVDRYLQLWNEPHERVRADRIALGWTHDATYTDPLGSVSGHDGVAAFVGRARELFPGHTFRLRGDVDGHHDVVRFGWDLVPEAGGEPVAEGFDVAVLTDDGRVRAVHGFLDRAPVL